MNTLYSGKTALITGATKGIGRAFALQLARAGYHIIAVGRTQALLESLDDAITAEGGSASLISLDLTEGELIDKVGLQLAHRFAHIDLLIANAAILGELGPVTHQDPRVWDQVISTNLTAPWRLLRSVEPLLRMAIGAKVVFVSDGNLAQGAAYWGAYAVAKAGLEQLATLYAHEVTTLGMTVELFTPGPTATNLRAKAMPGEDASTLLSPEEVVANYLPTLRGVMPESVAG